MILEIAGGIVVAWLAIKFWKVVVVLAGWAIIIGAGLAAYFSYFA